jgi:hypothetical protein
LGNEPEDILGEDVFSLLGCEAHLGTPCSEHWAEQFPTKEPA